MARLACISLPAFPLQILLRREPSWKQRPAAVVEEDRPQAKILWVNEHARRLAVLPGMRYAAGLSLASTLCAGVVSKEALVGEVDAVAGRLQKFSPHVEPCPSDPGVFWIDASGLARLHPTWSAWAGLVHEGLLKEEFLGRIVIGFYRFGTYAIAQSRQGPRTIIFNTKAEEGARAKQVRLNRLHIEPAVRDDLHALGIDTVGDLLRLPPAGLRTRYGADVHRLHEAARDELGVPLQPMAEEEPVRQELLLDHPEKNAERLLFLVKRMLDPLLGDLVQRGRALTELVIELKLERGEGRTEHLKPADPTVDAGQLLNLVLLRLAALQLRAGVVELALDADSTPATREQLSLFRQQRKRDLSAAKRAFARLRAELGDGAVVCAQLREGHLPEASFAWAPLTEAAFPKPPATPDAQRTLVRRILTRPLPLPHRPRHEADGWLVRGRDDPPVAAVCGPYVVSGGWWRAEVHREYHYIRNQKGEWLWVYYDKHRRRWFLQGRIE